MKIDYKNLPFLRDIENGTLESFLPACELDAPHFQRCKALLEQFWPIAAEQVRKNVCIPSKSYLEAIEKSAPCFTKLIDSICPTKVEASEWVDPQELGEYTEEQQVIDEKLYDLIGGSYGCYILSTLQMVVYGSCNTPVRQDFCFEIIGDAVTRAFVQYNDDYVYFCTQHSKMSPIYHEISIYPIAIVAQLQREAHMFTMFERYAKVETRYINPKMRARIDLKSLESSTNETRLKVHIRDSRYFTEIIRKEGFMVSGHLRLQPRKRNGEWTRELIYIDSYQKHGYHRQAQIQK